MWFGRIDEEIRRHLLGGFLRCVEALDNLSCANFVKYTDDFGLSLGCTPATLPGQAAAVCRTDIKNRTIAFTREFCKLEEISGGRDSRVSVLIHEVTHFADVFGTGDPYYFFYRAKRAAVSDPEGVRNNADSYAGYVVWETSFLD
ncbi:hypothetical protein GN316_21220 [Xylophilus sp. Kf1]|nr:hypothetical protein [Xylophilus sp. Kf1]